MTREEFDHMFEVDSRGRFVRLIIPPDKEYPEFNLIGKEAKDYTLAEVVRMKTYRHMLWETVENP